MAQYATYDEFLMYGGIPERVLKSANPPVMPSEVDGFLKAASETIESYVSPLYASSIPLQTTSLKIIICVVALAAYDIMSMRVGFKPDGSDKSFKAAYDTQIAWLKDIALGKAVLPGSEGLAQKDDYSGPDVASNPKRYDDCEGYRNGFWERR